MNARPHFPLLAVVLTLAFAFAGCASAAGGPAAGPGDTITRVQLEEMGAGTLYEAVERFHPEWLRHRLYDQPPVVLVDGNRVGDPGALYGINIHSVMEVRYLDASDATTRYGTGFGGGAIEVDTRTGRTP